MIVDAPQSWHPMTQARPLHALGEMLTLSSPTPLKARNHNTKELSLAFHSSARIILLAETEMVTTSLKVKVPIWAGCDTVLDVRARVEEGVKEYKHTE